MFIDVHLQIIPDVVSYVEEVLRKPNPHQEHRPVVEAVATIKHRIGIRLGSIDPDLGLRFRERAGLVTKIL